MRRDGEAPLGAGVPRAARPDGTGRRRGWRAHDDPRDIRKAARVVTQLYDEALRSQDLRGTQFTLLVVVRSRGPVTVKQLAETTVTDRTTLTRNLRPLEKKRLIRIEAGKDRRERIVTLTDRGDRTLANALPLWDRAQAQITSGLGQERLRRLLADL